MGIWRAVVGDLHSRYVVALCLNVMPLKSIASNLLAAVSG